MKVTGLFDASLSINVTSAVLPTLPKVKPDKVLLIFQAEVLKAEVKLVPFG